jgi:hypothetical protein
MSSRRKKATKHLTTYILSVRSLPKQTRDTNSHLHVATVASLQSKGIWTAAISNGDSRFGKFLTFLSIEI